MLILFTRLTSNYKIEHPCTYFAVKNKKSKEILFGQISISCEARDRTGHSFRQLAGTRSASPRKTLQNKCRVANAHLTCYLLFLNNNRIYQVIPKTKKCRAKNRHLGERVYYSSDKQRNATSAGTKRTVRITAMHVFATGAVVNTPHPEKRTSATQARSGSCRSIQIFLKYHLYKKRKRFISNHLLVSYKERSVKKNTTLCFEMQVKRKTRLSRARIGIGGWTLLEHGL